MRQYGAVTVAFFIIITILLTTVSATDTKKTQHDSDMNTEIDDEAIGDQQQQMKNNATTEQMIQQLIAQLHQIQQKILIIQKKLPKQQKQELPSPRRGVQAVQQQQQQNAVEEVKLLLNNTVRLNSSAVEERKTNASLKAQIKEFRHRFAGPREQFRKMARVRDQPQTQIATSLDKPILKEVARAPSRQPLPIAKPDANKLSNQTLNIAVTEQPHHLPLATTTQQTLTSMSSRAPNQTQLNADNGVIDKDTELSLNSTLSPIVAVKCPKNEWQKIMEKAIKADDPNISIAQLQAELARTEHGIFVVMCSMVKQREQFSKNLKLKGNTYCQVVKDNVWCHAGGLSLKNGATFQIGR